MSRKTICFRSALALVALLALALTGLSALAATRTETDYEVKDAIYHYVYVTVWDGGDKSGRGVVGDYSYVERHTFEDGRCVYCGYSGYDTQAPAPTPLPKTKRDAAEETRSDGNEADAPKAARATFVAASGAILTRGTPAAEALKQALAAIPAGSGVTVAGVSGDVADRLIAAIDDSADPAGLLALLASFPAETVDGVACYVVTLQYAGADGSPVSERYAFSAADGALVKVF